jgi:hypothetical protein
MYAQKLLLAWTPQELPEGRRGNALVQKECRAQRAIRYCSVWLGVRNARSGPRVARTCSDTALS